MVGDDTPLQDKDPYDGDNAFKSAATDKPEGDTVLTGSDSEITIKTQYSKDTADTLENTVVIE